MKKVLAVALLALVTGAQAESTAAKKELISKLLQLQQPGIEMMARSLAEQPAAVMMQQAGMILQNRIAPEKREALARELQGDAKSYLEDVVPQTREHAIKLAPTTIGVVLEEKFTEDELRQIIAIVESPVHKKFIAVSGEMDKALGNKLVAEMQVVIEPRAKLMEQSMSKRLGLPSAGGSAAPGAAKPAAKAPKK